MDPRLNAKGELTLSLADFQRADYGQLCALLKLKPSSPHVNAAGRDTRRKARS